MTTLTAQKLRDLFSYDPKIGHLIRKKTVTCSKAGVPAGTKMKKGYRRLRVNNEVHLEHRLVWLYVTGEWPKHQIDHINCVKDDNRFSNLREATPAQNKWNMGPRSDKKIGKYKGVYYHRLTGRWEARIMAHGVSHCLGYAATEEEAAEIYRESAPKIHGEFVWENG